MAAAVNFYARKARFLPLLFNRRRETRGLCGFQYHKEIRNLFSFLCSGTIIFGKASLRLLSLS